MIEEYYKKICEGDEVRQNLITVRQEIKKDTARDELRSLLGGDYAVFTALLSDQDPKVRKNAALILGVLGSEDSAEDEILSQLYEAYLREETLYIRTDYLKAIEELDYRPLAAELEKRMTELSSSDRYPAEDRKHLNAELHELQMMILHCQGIRRHRISDMRLNTDVILTTNRCQREATAEQIKKGKITMLAGGIRVENASLKELLSIRSYQELLFPIGSDSFSSDPYECAASVADLALDKLKMLCHDQGPYLFRAEIRGISEESDRGSFLRKFSAALESDSHMQLMNSVSDYEAEIRLILRKDGHIAAMLKPMGLAERRFSYRKEFVSASIAPVNAALTVYLAMPYLKEGARILDPFCGVGTMLIERAKALKTGSMYGIDHFGEAVEKGRRNADRAGCKINFVNRDFFTFEHRVPFDELITDMPQVTAAAPKREIRSLYHQFFAKAQGLLTSRAVLVIYSTEPNYVLEAVQESQAYEIEKKFLINEKKGTTVFVIFTK